MYLLAGIAIGVLGLITQPLWARLSDRIGRRPVFATSMLLSAALLFVFFPALASANTVYWLAALVALALVSTGANAVGASFYTEMFPTRVRYTGAALGTQLGFIVAGFAPTIMTALQGPGTGGWIGPVVFAASCLVIAAATAWSAKETAKTDLHELGEKPLTA